MSLIDELTCPYCKRVYSDPYMLDCCEENICKSDIDKIMANDGICPNAECQEKLTKFTSNKILKKLIEKYELNKISINSEYGKVLTEFKEKIDKIEKINKDPNNFIYEKFLELELKVDLDREIAIQSINKQADEIMDKLKEHKEKFTNNCKLETKMNNCQELIDTMRNEEESYEKIISSLAQTNQEKDKKKLEIKEKIINLESEIEKYKRILFDNVTIEYEKMSSELKFEEIFGKLIVRII